MLAAGIIGEPFNASNEEAQKWIALTSWTYSRSFEVSSDMLAKSHVMLVSLGLDTVASVHINGEHVLDTDNMFQRLRVNVKPLLMAGNNTISVKFESKVSYASSNPRIRYLSMRSSWRLTCRAS